VRVFLFLFLFFERKTPKKGSETFFFQQKPAFLPPFSEGLFLLIFFLFHLL